MASRPKWQRTGWWGEVIENGPYSEPLPISNEVWVTVVVIFFNGVVPWQITFGVKMQRPDEGSLN